MTLISKMYKGAALTVIAMCMATGSASAETFRWAGTTDPQTMDPHAVNAVNSP